MRQGMEQAMNGLFMMCMCHFDSSLKVPHRYRPIYSIAQTTSVSPIFIWALTKVRCEKENKSSKWLQRRVKFKCMLYRCTQFYSNIFHKRVLMLFIHLIATQYKRHESFGKGWDLSNVYLHSHVASYVFSVCQKGFQAPGKQDSH